MTSQKKRNRARRQVEKTMAEAFTALERGESALARRLSRRAVDAGHVNPRIWLDHGRVAAALGDLAEAEEAFRQSIRIAPTFAAAFRELARLQAVSGKWAPALRLGRRAVELAPDDPDFAAEVQSWVAAHPDAAEPPADPGPVATAQPIAGPRPVPRSERTERHDWTAVAEAVGERGGAVLVRLFDGDDVDAARALAGSDAVETERCYRDGEAWRSEWPLRAPLPDWLAAWRRELWARCTEVAAAIDARLGRSIARSPHLDEYLEDVTDRPDVALLRLDPGAALEPRSAADADAAPLAWLIDLGGDDRAAAPWLEDLRPGRKRRRRAFRTRMGDALLHVTRDRPVAVGGVVGLQRVALGSEPAADGSRWWLRVGFDG